MGLRARLASWADLAARPRFDPGGLTRIGTRSSRAKTSRMTSPMSGANLSGLARRRTWPDPRGQRFAGDLTVTLPGPAARA
jgi:hypothetical protein